MRLPSNRELRGLCLAFLREPGSQASTSDWATRFGMTARTLERRFRGDLAMTFCTWRRLARVEEAKRRLAAGERVTVVATDLGYDSISAFGAMFRKVTGVAPSHISPSLKRRSETTSDEDGAHPGRTFATSTSPERETSVIKDIAFSAYPAADVAKLRDFYVHTLGLELSEPMAGEDGTPAYCEGKVGDGYFALLLDAWLERPKGSGAGVVFEVEDLAQMTADLRAKGFVVSEPMEFTSCKLANFEDPEGNKVSLHETLSR